MMKTLADLRRSIAARMNDPDKLIQIVLINSKGILLEVRPPQMVNQITNVRFSLLCKGRNSWYEFYRASMWTFPDENTAVLTSRYGGLMKVVFLS